MEYPVKFIGAGPDYMTRERCVPAPYLRKSFELDHLPSEAEMIICGLGFYELYINGKKITKGALAPYISAPDDLVYYDRYQVADLLRVGENVIGICLGNGFQNNPYGYIWAFEKTKWIGAPRMALRLELRGGDGEGLVIESDESFVAAASPILFDDMRMGETYDARKEIPGWNEPGFDDGSWNPASLMERPRGEPQFCEAEPIVVTGELKPVSITAVDGGYLYDFGLNCAGVCRLTVRGEPGQEIKLYHGEHLIDGRLNLRNLTVDRCPEAQRIVYYCGGGEESYTPSFCYFGFRYVMVYGVAEEQASEDLLTYVVMNSDLEERGGFSCSDEMVNKIQEITRRSTLGNFYYFPTDCPHREKNGWTADAALSAEHTLLNLGAENSYREWMRNIRAAQAKDGCLPGIVPTGDWGYEKWTGPAWDCVIVWLPYYTYVYRGDRRIVEENAHAILRYLEFVNTRIRPDGLIAFGLGDWCPVGRQADQYKSPLEFTDTVITMDMAEKAAYLFGELGLELSKSFAEGLYQKLRKAARERLLDLNTMTALGDCQTSQAMAIYFSLFEHGEKPEAFRRLMEIIARDKKKMDVGVLGGRVLFHVLSQFGQTDIALEMIARPEYPSYGNWIVRGATALWEDFHEEDDQCNSLNHHFWGDVSHWFIRHLAGIHYNDRRAGGEVDICPSFVKRLRFAQGFHMAPEGKISVRWERREGCVILEVEVPEGLSGNIRLQQGYVFSDGLHSKPAASGSYTVMEKAGF